MKTAPLLVVCSLLAGLAGGALALALRPIPRVEGRSEPVALEDLSLLRAEVQALRGAREEDARRLRELESSASMGHGAAREPVGLDSAQLEAWLTENAGLLRDLVQGEESALAAAEELVTERDLLEAMDALLDPSIDDITKQELWAELAEKGATDDLVRMFEERAQRDPNNPDAHVELAYAYVQKIFEAGNSPAAGMWATKADKAYDAALVLDPNHWEARFSKAVGLSFWPPVFGKQAEAISQFEQLVEIQKQLPPSSEHAQTFVLLGNLHQQSGDQEAALFVWQEGLSVFPEDEELLAKLAGGGGG